MFLDEPIYMEISEGFENYANEPVPQDGREHILQLKKTIYGVVQASRAFNNSMDKCLDDLKLNRSKSDPCVYHKCHEKGTVIIIVYIDD